MAVSSEEITVTVNNAAPPPQPPTPPGAHCANQLGWETHFTLAVHVNVSGVMKVPTGICLYFPFFKKRMKHSHNIWQICAGLLVLKSVSIPHKLQPQVKWLLGYPITK